MMSRDQWRKFLDQPWVEWGLFAVGVILVIIGIIVAAPARPGRCVLRRARRRADPQDQHVGEAALCEVQAMATQGGPLDRLGASTARRAKRREAIRKAEQQQSQLPETGE